MASRQRTTSFRPQLSVRRVYETLQPQSETKELPEAYLLRVYLPGLFIYFLLIHAFLSILLWYRLSFVIIV